MAEKAKAKKSQWIHLVIMFVLMCSGWFLPSGETLTEYGVRITMIFVGAIWGWIFAGLIVPNLVRKSFY